MEGNANGEREKEVKPPHHCLFFLSVLFCPFSHPVPPPFPPAGLVVTDASSLLFVLAFSCSVSFLVFVSGQCLCPREFLAPSPLLHPTSHAPSLSPPYFVGLHIPIDDHICKWRRRRRRRLPMSQHRATHAYAGRHTHIGPAATVSEPVGTVKGNRKRQLNQEITPKCECLFFFFFFFTNVFSADY